MTPEQYQKFKQEHLTEVERTCPVVMGFIKKIYQIIEWSLSGEMTVNMERG